MPDATLGPMAGNQTGVAAPSHQVAAMAHWWEVIDAVVGGTSKVRELGVSYLPKEPGEGDSAYRRRLSRVVLSPWYMRLVRGLVGMVLRKPVKIDDESLQVKDQKLFAEQLEDVNLVGDNLQVFARDLFESAVNYSYAGVLVEYPEASEIQTRADELAMGLRPYWVLYEAKDILGFQWEQVGATRKLTQVRLRQRVEEDADEFSTKLIEQVLVFDQKNGLVTWRIFRESKTRTEWELHKSGMISLDEIPFAICYTDKKCRLELQPPMLEIAYLNLKHYQLCADLDHALHIASVPRLFIFGATPDEIGDLDSIDEAVCISRAEARLEWSSAKIDSFQPLQSRIGEIEQQMSALGLSAIVGQKNVGESAEAKRLDRTQGDSMAGVVAQSLQNCLNLALYYHAQYLGQPITPTCTVSRDFDLTQLDPTMLNALTALRQSGNLSRQTFLELLQTGEIGLADTWKPEEEIARLDAEFSVQAKPVLPDINQPM